MREREGAEPKWAERGKGAVPGRGAEIAGAGRGERGGAGGTGWGRGPRVGSGSWRWGTEGVGGRGRGDDDTQDLVAGLWLPKRKGCHRVGGCVPRPPLPTQGRE